MKTKVQAYIHLTNDKIFHDHLLDGRMCILPCDCGDKYCEGWATAMNNPPSIKSHMDLYAPKEGKEK